MFEMILAAVMVCAPTLIQIDANAGMWNTHDQKILRHVQSTAGCAQVYPKSPCVSVFHKKADQAYTVICKPKQPKEIK